MKLTISANGDATGTKVLTEGGIEISDMVTGVAFEHRAGCHPMVTIDLAACNGEMTGRALVRVVDPRTGELRLVRAITFADGESLEFAPDDTEVRAIPPK